MIFITITLNNGGGKMSRLQRGINDLQTVNPSLSNEWDYSKNDKTPSDYTYGSNRKVWWICSACGYSWNAQINARNCGNGCPNCRYRKSAKNTIKTRLKSGSNSLRAANPSFLAEWDIEKNGDLCPDDVTPKSHKKVWWRCSRCGASYHSQILGRTSEDKGCPVCSGRTVQEGINDLASINPTVASEWDYSANGELLPTMVTAKNTRKVGWICSVCGARWKASISDRNLGTGCPNCSKAYHSSFPEQAVYWYILERFPEAVNGYRPSWLKGYGEIDIYIPTLNLGIEYDGLRWHQQTTRDTRKGTIIHKNGVQLIRIRGNRSIIPHLQPGAIS